MRISLIIPVINEAAQISAAIESAWAAGVDEVIVADGGSTDDTRQLATEAKCKLIQATAGRAIQMNAGARQSSGDVLLFLHADNRLSQDAGAQIRVELLNTQILFGGFCQAIDHPGKIYRWLEWGNAQRIRWQGLIYGDQAMFVRGSTFESIGGFPEIRLMEDWELSHRLNRQSRPALLPGPTTVSPRRWEHTGPVRQTLKNWYLTTAYRLGASPEWLAQQYRRHDH